MEIELKTCKLRKWDLTDVDSLAYNANNYSVWINMNDAFPNPYKPINAEAWINLVKDSVPVTVFAIEVNGKAVGGIGFHPGSDVTRLEAEIGYWLGEDHWNKGIISEALPAVINYAFEQFDIVRLFAKVFEWNLHSMKLLEKNGFQLEGILRKAVLKDGKLINVHLYSKIDESKL